MVSTLTRGIKSIVPGCDSRTVDDRLDAVLLRLDSGEELTKGILKRDDKFCVMGLFADESGIVKWEGDKYKRHRHAYTNILDMDVVQLFRLRDPIGSFDLEHAPDEIKQLILDHFGSEVADLNKVSLTTVNDGMLALDKKAEVNSVLATIIRSGVVFNK